MGMPTEPLIDIMRRSMANLAFVEAHAGSDGPYEVTQLVNTFLGALVHPFEAMRNDLMELPLAEAAVLGWPSIARERPDDSEPASLGGLIRLMRNGMAHGNINFLSDGKGQVHSLRVWNTQPKTHARTWGAVVAVQDMRRLLSLFVELIEYRHKDFDERGAA
ncbi:HEPN family nuclease [Mesorhizobium sp. M0482]|uniref:HEPN family nuclease n=1 Tax=Mesorhizobium sp. M0482 TaxID=2956948 RepID=UPI00333689F9